MKNPNDEHRCPTCGVRHSTPKAHRVLRLLAWCVVLTVVESVIALTLDGWMAWALWAIAARNVFIGVLVIVGLANLAVDKEARR